MIDGFKRLESTPHLDFGVDERRRLLLLVRHNTPDATAVELERALRGIQALLEFPVGWSILMDVRATVGRSDPEFERDAERFREYMLEHFERVAVLVRSAVGKLQVQRFADPHARMLVFRDLDEALAWLDAGD